MSAKVRASSWLQRAFPVAVLVVPLLALALVVFLFGSTVLQRIVTVMFINLIVVVGLQTFTGNSGVLSFGHISFMGIGAYASVLFSMSPDDKALALRRLYDILAGVHLPFFPSLLIGAGTAALVAILIGFPLMRLSGAAAVIATFALLVIIHVIFINWDEVSRRYEAGK